MRDIRSEARILTLPAMTVLTFSAMLLMF